MGIAGEARRTVRQFSQATGLSKKDAQKLLESMAPSGRHAGLSEGDVYRIAADVAKMVTMLGPNDDFADVIRIMRSGWEAGSLKTLAGRPMRDHTDLVGVCDLIVALAKTFWPDLWETTCAKHPDLAQL